MKYLKKYEITFLVSVLFFSFYMLVYYKLNHYSPFRTLSYNLSFSALLLLNIFVITSVIMNYLKKSAERILFYSILFLSVFVVLLSMDWLAGINIFASHHRFKIVIILFQIAQIFVYLFNYIFNNRESLSAGPPDPGRCPVLWFIGPAVYISAVIFIITPVRLYATSPGEIEQSLLSLVFPLSVSFISALSVFTGLFFLLPLSARKHLNFILLSVSGLVFFFTFIAPGNFGALDKFMLTGAENLYNRFSINLFEVIFIITYVNIVFFLVRTGREKMLSAVFILLLLVAAFETTFAASRSVKAAVQHKTEEAGTVSLLPEYNSRLMGYTSEGKNIVVIMLDMLTGGYIEQILDELPDERKNLAGFIWYPNTLSIGYNTSTSVPAMYGGWKYSPVEINKSEAGKTLLEWIVESYEVLPSMLSGKGYVASYTDPDYYRTPHGDLEALNDLGVIGGFNRDYVPYWKYLNRDETDSGMKVSEGLAPRLLTMVSVFKASPFLLKPVIYDNGDWLVIGKEEIRNRAYSFALNSWAFLDLMKDVSNTDEKNNTFKYFHNYVTHEPYAMSREGALIKDEFPDPEAGNNVHGRNAYYSAKAAIQAVSRWVTWLRNNNIYDNTMIVLVSDHGNSLTENPMMEEGFAAGDITETIITRAHAFLMVKDFERNDQLSVDYRFMSNADVPAIVARGAGIAESDIGKDPTIGPPPETRTLDTVKSDSWRWEYLIRNSKYNIEWHYQVKDSIFYEKNWKKIK